MTENADEKRLNQAEILEDGQQVTVWTPEEAAAVPVEGEAETGSGKVNLNTASRETLMTLPGIGRPRRTPFCPTGRNTADLKIQKKFSRWRASRKSL